MPLEAGTRLGSYEIQGMLGAGGMGEVYRARDTRLDRDVAIKVLPPKLTEDAAALGRFEREAKAVAALAHPNILSIYDFGSEGGLTYAVMELLEGETLRERLDQGALPPRKAADLAGQVAQGLAAAHARRIVHRDLKPENIFVSPDGGAKVLDFGLAAGVKDSAGGGAAANTGIATRTSLTAPGTVMGTVGYMAPEQVRGETADHRADIFALGCVLHEMLSGKRAFARDTGAETMTAILREDPEAIDSVSGTVSPALERVVRRCLEKNPEERFQSARDLAFAIDNSMSVSGIGHASQEAGQDADASREWRTGRAMGWPVVGAAVVLGLVAGMAITTALRPPGIATEPVRVRTLTVSGRDVEPSVSPDGRLIAFRSGRDGTPRIWIKQLAGGGEEPLTAGHDSMPRFSPDGSTLLFMRDEDKLRSVYRQALIGGEARKVLNDAVEATWSPDGNRIAFIRDATEEGRRTAAVGVANAQGGDEHILVQRDRAMGAVRWSPDGATIAVAEASVTGNNTATNRLLLVDVESAGLQVVNPSEGHLVAGVTWTAGNDLLLALAGSLVGDQADTTSRFVHYEPDGGSVTTLFWSQHLFPLLGIQGDATVADIVAPGTIVFHQRMVRQGMREMELEDDGMGDLRVRDGSDHVLTRTEGRDRQPIYSPDGKRLLFSSNRTGNLDLWSLDLESGQLRQLTDDMTQDWDPAFSPDGREIAWSSDRSGSLEIWMANADGSAARQLTQDGVDAENPTFTGDGQWVVYWSANPDKIGIWKIRRDGSQATQLVAGAFLGPDVSPDGRYVAYIAMELDILRSVIFAASVETSEVLPFQIEVPMPLLATYVLFGRLRWLPDGSGLAYIGVDEQNRTGVFVQDFVADQQDTSASRRPLAGFSPDYVTESLDISPDGKRITLSTLETTGRLMLAEGVPGISPPR